MDRESENIFDEAGKQANKGKGAKKKKKMPPSQQRALTPDRYRGIVDPEIDQIFSRIREMQDDLNTKIAYIKSQAGSYFRNVEELLDHPELLNVPAAKETKEKQEQLENAVSSVVGIDVKKRAEKKQKEKEQKKGKKAHKLKGKKRDWLSMD